MLRSVNPFNEQVLGEFPLMNAKDVQAKVAKAYLTFKSWRKCTFPFRSDLMKNVARNLVSKKDDYAKIISLEMGKTLKEARAEIQKCADGCLYFAENAEQFLRDDLVKTEAVTSFVTYQPTGVVLAIMPWNFPFWQVFRFAGPALMAGNVALLKHASNVPQCSQAIENIFHEAGFPEGSFQSLFITNEQVESVICADAVQGIALTGSENAGSIVGSLAGKHIKKTVLELGGSDPFIVLPDADLEKTVQIATQSRMQNAGQSCIAAKRFIVHKNIGDKFTERFKHQIEALRQGDPLDENTTTGPLARTDLAETLETQMKTSIEKGARLVTGGTRHKANFQPALVDNVRTGMPAFDEETFGPLAAVTYVESEAEAIEIANSSRYGLGASVWTNDLERAERVAREIESGSVFVNALMRSDSRLPFGGIKKSGYGRELSFLGIKEFVNAKTISVHKF